MINEIDLQADHEMVQQDHELILTLKNQIEDAWGGIDILVANVGNGRSIPEPIAPKEHFDRVFVLNFDTAVNTAREFYPLLKNVKGESLSLLVILCLHTLIRHKMQLAVL